MTPKLRVPKVVNFKYFNKDAFGWRVGDLNTAGLNYFHYPHQTVSLSWYYAGSAVWTIMFHTEDEEKE